MYLALRAVEVVRRPGELVKVDVGADVHLARVDLHDARAGLLRRRRELDLAVEAAGPEEQLWVKSRHFSSKILHSTKSHATKVHICM